MKKTGLLRKHPEDSLLIAGFRKYLEVSYSHSFIRHQVPSVARYLYFMDPGEVSVKCIHNIRKTVEFFVHLNALNTSKPTARNYLESIRSFARYVASEERLLKEDPSMPQAVEKFLNAAKYILIGIRRRRVPAKPGKENQICTPEGCQRLLTTVKPYFLSLISRATSGSELEDRDYIAVCNYLVALLLLQHLQRPGVVRDMTVHQWLLRSHLPVQVDKDTVEVAIIRVEYRTAEITQTAIIALEKEEEMWFDTFFRKIRPVFMKNMNKGEHHFFVSSNGGKMKNLTYTHKRFQERFHLPVVKLQQARKVFGQCCLSGCNDKDKQLLKRYLRPSEPGAAENSEADLVRATVMVSRMQKHWSPSPSRDVDLQGPGGEGEDNSAGVALMEEKEMCFKRTEDVYPISINRAGPGIKACNVISKAHGSYCYKRWRRQQYRMRVEDVIGRFKRKPPTEDQIRSYMKVQGWKYNAPRLPDILESWKPSVDRGKVDHTEEIERLVDSQDWKGLAIVEDRAGNTGETVITTLPFQKGDFVCDCHGPVVSHERGEEIMNSIGPGEMCYLYFFKDNKSQRRLCIDAQNVPCPCHPGLSTYGRKINHSKRKPNLKPEVRYLKNGTSPVILLIAKEDIDVGTELTFDYGVTMHIQQRHMAHQEVTLGSGHEPSQSMPLVLHEQEMQQVSRVPQEMEQVLHVHQEQEMWQVSQVPHDQELEPVLHVPQEQVSGVPQEQEIQQTSHVLQEQEMAQVSHVPLQQEMAQVSHVPQEQEMEQVSHVPQEQEMKQVSYVPQEQEMQQTSHALQEQEMKQVSHVPQEMEQVSHVPQEQEMEQVSHVPQEQEMEQVSHVPQEQEMEQVSHVPQEQEMEQVSHVPQEQEMEQVSHVPQEQEMEQVSHVPQEQEMEQVSHVPQEQELEQVSLVRQESEMQQVPCVHQEMQQASNVLQEMQQASNVLQEMKLVSNVSQEQEMNRMPHVSLEMERVSHVPHDQELVSHVPKKQEIQQMSHVPQEMQQVSNDIQCVTQEQEMEQVSDVPQEQEMQQVSCVSQEIEQALHISQVMKHASDVSQKLEQVSDVSQKLEQVSDVSQKLEQVSDVSQKLEQVSDVSQKLEQVSDVSQKLEQVSDVSQKLEQVSDVSQKLEQVSDVSQKLEQVSDVSQETEQASHVFQETEQVSDVSQETEQASDVFQETEQASNVFQETEQVSDVSQETEQASDVFQETEQASNVFQETGQASDVFQETGQASDIFQETGQASDVFQETEQLSDVSQETEQASDVFQETGQASDVFQETEQASNVFQEMEQLLHVPQEQNMKLVSHVSHGREILKVTRIPQEQEMGPVSYVPQEQASHIQELQRTLHVPQEQKERITHVPRDQERASREESIGDLHEDGNDLPKPSTLSPNATQREAAETSSTTSEGIVPPDSEPMEAEEDDGARSEQSEPSRDEFQVGSGGSRISVDPEPMETEEEEGADSELPGPSWAALQAGLEGSRCRTFAPTFLLKPDLESEDETSLEEEPLDLSSTAPLPHSPQDGSGESKGPTFTLQLESESEDEASSMEEPLDLSCSAPLPHSPRMSYPLFRSPPSYMDVPTPTTGAYSPGPVMEDCPPSAPGSPPPPPPLNSDPQLWLLFEVQRQQLLLQRRSQRTRDLQVQQQRRHFLAMQRGQQRIERHLLTISRKLEDIHQGLRPATRAEPTQRARTARGRRSRPCEEKEGGSL